MIVGKLFLLACAAFGAWAAVRGGYGDGGPEAWTVYAVVVFGFLVLAGDK